MSAATILEYDYEAKSQSEIQADLKRAHMQLVSERGRVQDLQREIKEIMEEKYNSESNMVSHLSQSQNRLREQLASVVKSKTRLCESTALEIEKLRVLVSVLLNQIQTASASSTSTSTSTAASASASASNSNSNSNRNGNKGTHPQPISIVSKPLRVSRASASASASALLPLIPHRLSQSIPAAEQQSQQSQHNQPQSRSDATSAAKSVPSVSVDGGYSIHDALFQSGLGLHLHHSHNNENENGNGNESESESAVFPHKLRSHIDIRCIARGESDVYPDPFAAVDLKYIGYKYNGATRLWYRFTNNNISNTVFETRLGNHENIIGLEQAVLSMEKGEVARVWVPARLGYGKHGAPPLIAPDTDLIFELTLVEIRNDYPNNSNSNSNGNGNDNHDDDDHNGTKI